MGDAILLVIPGRQGLLLKEPRSACRFTAKFGDRVDGECDHHLDGGRILLQAVTLL